MVEVLYKHLKREKCYKLQITNYKLQITNYKLQITNYKLQITNLSYFLFYKQKACIYFIKKKISVILLNNYEFNSF
jgi:hypothetical protein